LWCLFINLLHKNHEKIQLITIFHIFLKTQIQDRLEAKQEKEKQARLELQRILRMKQRRELARLDKLRKSQEKTEKTRLERLRKSEQQKTDKVTRLEKSTQTALRKQQNASKAPKRIFASKEIRKQPAVEPQKAAKQGKLVVHTGLVGDEKLSNTDALKSSDGQGGIQQKVTGVGEEVSPSQEDASKVGGDKQMAVVGEQSSLAMEGASNKMPMEGGGNSLKGVGQGHTKRECQKAEQYSREAAMEACRRVLEQGSFFEKELKLERDAHAARNHAVESQQVAQEQIEQKKLRMEIVKQERLDDFNLRQDQATEISLCLDMCLAMKPPKKIMERLQVHIPCFPI